MRVGLPVGLSQQGRAQHCESPNPEGNSPAENQAFLSFLGEFHLLAPGSHLIGNPSPELQEGGTDT